jgi:hypothetical protein
MVMLHCSGSKLLGGDRKSFTNCITPLIGRCDHLELVHGSRINNGFFHERPCPQLYRSHCSSISSPTRRASFISVETKPISL